MGQKRPRVIGLYTKLLRRHVRILGCAPNAREMGRMGEIVSVYLTAGGPRYTVMLKDGRLIESSGEGIIVER